VSFEGGASRVGACRPETASQQLHCRACWAIECVKSVQRCGMAAGRWGQRAGPWHNFCCWMGVGRGARGAQCSAAANEGRVEVSPSTRAAERRKKARQRDLDPGCRRRVAASGRQKWARRTLFCSLAKVPTRQHGRWLRGCCLPVRPSDTLDREGTAEGRSVVTLNGHPSEHSAVSSTTSGVTVQSIEMNCWP
jgi:hypothetical protein